MKKTIMMFAAICSATLAFAAPKVKEYKLVSPDSKLQVAVTVGEKVEYSVTHEGVQVIAPSEISMQLADGTAYDATVKFSKMTKRSVDQTIDAFIYKKDKVRDNFNEITLTFKTYSLIFRAYDAGMAYRFVSHSKVPFQVVSEQATFAFPGDWNAYIPYVNARKNAPDKSQFYTSFESQYTHSALSKWDANRISISPMMVEEPSGKKICITEADLLNYPGMFLRGSGTSVKGVFAPYPKEVKQGGHNNLQMEVYTRENYIAKYDGATSFPWRVVAVSSRDVQMADNDLVYSLATPADPSVDYSWVKPGKVAWDWWNDWNLYGVDFESGINNETYKYYIDFASKNGIEYVILDEGWAVNRKADLFQVIPQINLEELVAYANERNVGLILWAGYWALDRDMEKVCKHYSEMGIKGFKVDFMDRDDQVMVDFHHRASQMGAKYKLMMDFHGTYKPTGLTRTYPNVVNYEGVFGLENMKWEAKGIDQVTYDVTVPYIRMVAGSMDYTQGAMRNAIKKNYNPVNSEAVSQGTRCRQLGEYVIFESPLNMLCDSPSNYLENIECTKFIAEIPTVWNETVAVDGQVAKYIVMARRSGETWYVGGLTNWDERDIEVDLNFLGEGKWQIELFRDGINANKAARDYKKEVLDLPASGKLKVHLAKGGGFAAKIVKK